jgi:hypothetical protein
MSEKEEPEIIQVGPMDPNKENSPIVEEAPPEEEAESKAICYFNGAAYTQGATGCIRLLGWKPNYVPQWYMDT